MTKTEAYINPDMLIWARETIKLSLELAAEKINVKPEKLSSWEKGIEYPSIRQLYKIAEIYKRPFSLFYFPKPPKHFKPLKDFRKFLTPVGLTENDEYLLQKELLLFQRKREIAIELYEDLDIPLPHFKLKGTIEEPTKVLAEKIIKHLKINHKEIANTSPGYEALNYWKKLLETAGILIFQTSGIPLHIMRGACIANEILPVIIINSNDTQNGRIFSLFHELVHIVLREDGISNFKYREKNLYDPVEVYCNQVAAEVLVPSDILLSSSIIKSHSESNTNWSELELKKLSQFFCVSTEVILRRLLFLSKTTKSFYEDFRNTHQFDDKKGSSGGDYYRNVIAKYGPTYLNLAIQGYHQNKVTSSSLYDFIQVKLSNLPVLEKYLYAKI